MYKIMLYKYVCMSINVINNEEEAVIRKNLLPPIFIVPHTNFYHMVIFFMFMTLFQEVFFSLFMCLLTCFLFKVIITVCKI